MMCAHTFKIDISQIVINFTKKGHFETFNLAVWVIYINESSVI